MLFCATYALATMALVGVHPVLTQVPPKSLRSMNATLRPDCVRRPASVGACLTGADDDGVEVSGHQTLETMKRALQQR